MMSHKHWKSPERFIPDRFIFNGEYFIPSKTFTPFGIGTRRCVGEKYALAALFIIFTRLIFRTNDRHLKLKIMNQQFLSPDREKHVEAYPMKYGILFE